MEHSWIVGTVAALTERYGKTFAAQWQSDTAGLSANAVSLLERLRLVHRIEGGLLALPALARYRGAVVTVRTRTGAPSLFDGEELS